MQVLLCHRNPPRLQAYSRIPQNANLEQNQRRQESQSPTFRQLPTKAMLEDTGLPGGSHHAFSMVSRTIALPLSGIGTSTRTAHVVCRITANRTQPRPPNAFQHRIIPPGSPPMVNEWQVERRSGRSRSTVRPRANGMFIPSTRQPKDAPDE
jgi:hypothetical protein